MGIGYSPLPHGPGGIGIRLENGNGIWLYTVVLSCVYPPPWVAEGDCLALQRGIAPATEASVTGSTNLLGRIRDTAGRELTRVYRSRIVRERCGDDLCCGAGDYLVEAVSAG